MKRIRTCLLLFVLMIGTGCISEDLSGCMRSYRLELSYQGDGTTEQFSRKIEHVVMYVFDGTDRCVASREATGAELAVRTLTLSGYAEGRYRVVCVGNARHTTVGAFAGLGITEMRFADPGWFAGEEISTNDSLYHAAVDISVTRGRSGRGVLHFSSSHYKLYVEVSGFEPETRGGLPRLEMHGVLPATDFENRACGDPVTYCLPTTSYDADRRMMTSRANIMRCIGDETQLELLDGSGTHLASVHLPTFLADHEEIDLTKNEVLIPIAFRFKEAAVEITVPDWYIEEVKPEI